MSAPRHPQPLRRDLTDPRSSGTATPASVKGVLNDRRSTRRRA